MSINMKKISPEAKQEAIDSLLEAAKNIKGENAAVVFVKHLLTESEQVTIGRRVLMSKLLLSGMSRSEIKAKLGVSPNTFSRTRKWLEQETPHYNEALADFKKAQRSKTTKKETVREKVAPFTTEAIKRKYPMESLLFNIIGKIKTK